MDFHKNVGVIEDPYTVITFSEKLVATFKMAAIDHISY